MSSSLREKQREQVRRDIDAAALQLFAERGYARVTTDEIAAAAGVSPSTYYRHVPTKEDLLLRPLRASSAAIVNGFASHPEDRDVCEGLIDAIRTQTGHIDAAEMRKWRSVVTAVPAILDRVALISDADRATLIQMTARRMRLDPDADYRPGVTVCTVLAVIEFGYRQWMTTANAESTLLSCIDQAIAASPYAT